MACIKSRRRPCRKTRPASGMSTCSTSPWQPSVVVSGGPSHSSGSRLVGLITASWDFVGRARPPPNERSRRTRGIRIRRKLGTPMPRLAVATEIRGSFPVLTGGGVRGPRNRRAKVLAGLATALRAGVSRGRARAWWLVRSRSGEHGAGLCAQPGRLVVGAAAGHAGSGGPSRWGQGLSPASRPRR